MGNQVNAYPHEVKLGEAPLSGKTDQNGKAGAGIYKSLIVAFWCST